jgi:hypothetical protein
LLQPLTQSLILLSQSVQFFIVVHACTVANLGSRSQLRHPLLKSYSHFLLTNK